MRVKAARDASGRESGGRDPKTIELQIFPELIKLMPGSGGKIAPHEIFRLETTLNAKLGEYIVLAAAFDRGRMLGTGEHGRPGRGTRVRPGSGGGGAEGPRKTAWGLYGSKVTKVLILHDLLLVTLVIGL